MNIVASQIRVTHYPFAVGVEQTTDVADLSAPSVSLSWAKIGDGESRQHATARALAMAARVLFELDRK